MKDYIQFETKIGLNSGSYRTSIPKEIAEYFEITTDEKLLWRLNIKTNEITIIPVPKTSKNTSDDIHKTSKKSKDSTVNIHETNKKPENKTTITDTNITNKENKPVKTNTPKNKTRITDPKIESNPLEYFEKLKDNDKTKTLNVDNKIRLRIFPYDKKKKEFGIEHYNTKKGIYLTKTKIGTLKQTIDLFNYLKELNYDEIKDYMIKKYPKINESNF